MFTVIVTERGGRSQTLLFEKAEVSIGRIQGNDIVLPKSNISKRHARIVLREGALAIIDSKSTNGTYINGKRIDEPYDLADGDRVALGDFTLEVHLGATADKRAEAEDRRATENWGEDQPLDDKWKDDLAQEGEEDRPLEDGFEEEPLDLGKTAQAKVRSRSEAGRAAEPSQGRGSPLPERSGGTSRAEARGAKSPTARGRPRALEPSLFSGPTSPWRTIHERLVRTLDLRGLDVESLSEEELRKKARGTVEEIVASMAEEGELTAETDREAMVKSVLDEVVELGPLAGPLLDGSVGEIFVNGATQIYIERDGKLVKNEHAFSSKQAVIRVIERLVASAGGHIDESSPMVEARLKDGSRLSAVLAPLALQGPCLTLRKPAKEPLQIDDLVAFGTLTPEISSFLETCVTARKNLVISGGAGSGKTTTLSVLSSFIPTPERIITIEDVAELKLDQEHVVSLEARPSASDGPGAVTVRDLVRHALRMQPDRIVVGDCRGGEALDMLQAMSGGQDGALTTVQANATREALFRLETMVLLGGMDLSTRAVRHLIASAVKVIIQLTRFADGSRRLTRVSEVTGLEDDVIATQDIFVFEPKGFDKQGKVQGRFRPTGAIPRFYETLKAVGVEADLSIFKQS
jgi:pilus assembly protein CpaF